MSVASKTLETLDPREYIIIKNAQVNNLKNLSVAIPRNQLIVVTGLSGSGKSSLAFDTLFAEGQRMYVESLSSYARQFLGRMEKPEVEYIRGVAPAIAVEQKQLSKNPRATVGTSTEIYDYLKLLFARIGITYSPISGAIVKKDTVTDVVNFTNSLEGGQKLMILAPLLRKEERSWEEELKIAFQKGFSRILIEEETVFLEDFLNDFDEQKLEEKEVFLLIDRNVVKKEDENNQFRIADSVQTAFFEGMGTAVILIPNDKKYTFSDRFEADGMLFEEPSTQFFSFNNPHGACRRCNGFGDTLAIDEDLVLPDKSLSLYEGVVAPWRSEKMSLWQKDFIKKAMGYDFPVHRSYRDLSEEEKELLWKGNDEISGIDDFFAEVQSQTHKIQYRVMLSRYRGKVTCPDCKGTRLRKDAAYVKIQEKSISDLVLMPVEDLLNFVENLKLTATEQKVARRLLIEIENRLNYLVKVGLGYLTLNRLTSSLSGGEHQRIKLATALGSALVGSMYILDEPSIGLHPRDTARLVSVLQDLRDLGNTVIVVEHEEEVMQAANQIIDIGPEAGSAGGNLVFQGKRENGLWEQAVIGQEIPESAKSYTLDFLNGNLEIPLPQIRRKWTEYLELKGARQHNLQNIDIKFPLGVFTVVTGVSGSGKSTLVTDVFYPALRKLLGEYDAKKVQYDQLSGNTKAIQHVEFIDQNPLGKSSRSNPATYTKVYDQIRQLFAQQALAKQRGYDAGYFSFNVDKGRCEVCEGEGKIKIEMQFMADIFLICESCNGKRFKKEILEVTYRDKNIAEVLEMTIDECLEFFKEEKKVYRALKPLSEVGLGYVGLGQSTNTLSGGESQRLKLASFLDAGKTEKGKRLFIFDEPTTGLHFQDIQKLLHALNKLIEQGNSVLVIEHNLEVIKSADWIIDLGPEGGLKGGKIVFEGTPEDLVKEKNNHTARFLKEKI